MPQLITRGLRSVVIPTNIAVATAHHLDNPMAEVDADQMVQVLTNLITNACAAMPDGGTLTIQTHDNADTMEILVEDSGSGIAQQNLGKIFEPFFTTKQIGEGTGLGLSPSVHCRIVLFLCA